LTRAVFERSDVIPLIAEFFRELGYEGASLSQVSERTACVLGTAHRLHKGARVMKPKDVLPDEVDAAVRNGIAVRKGSVGAFLANARILQEETATAEAREVARADLIDLVPAMAALGLFELFSIRDPDIAALVEQTILAR
jgi:hypothetical protein